MPLVLTNTDLLSDEAAAEVLAEVAAHNAAEKETLREAQTKIRQAMKEARDMRANADRARKRGVGVAPYNGTAGAGPTRIHRDGLDTITRVAGV